MDFTFDHQNTDFDLECDIDQQLLSEFSGLAVNTHSTHGIEAKDSPFAKRPNKIANRRECSLDGENWDTSSHIWTNNQWESYLMKCNKRNWKKASKSLKTTKEQISYLLKIMAQTRKSQELARVKTFEEHEKHQAYFISMKDVLWAETD